MRAHAHDLRAEVAADFGFTDAAEADRFVQQIATDWRGASLDAPHRALCLFAEKLTLHPAEMTADDLDVLRGHGFDDRAIHDAVQVIGYFNYINRVADALGVEFEPEEKVKAWERAKSW